MLAALAVCQGGAQPPAALLSGAPPEPQTRYLAAEHCTILSTSPDMQNWAQILFTFGGHYMLMVSPSLLRPAMLGCIAYQTLPNICVWACKAPEL